nr:unnamed protein product [Callosobruchus chinensis]
MPPKSASSKHKYDEELRSLQLDRPDFGPTKSETDIQKHSIDEQLINKPVERTLYILT